MKQWWNRFKEFVYLVTIISIAAGWYVDHRVTKRMNEMREQAQDAKISEQANRINTLEFETQKNKGYAKENADNIVWLVRVWELDSKSGSSQETAATGYDSIQVGASGRFYLYTAENSQREAGFTYQGKE